MMVQGVVMTKSRANLFCIAFLEEGEMCIYGCGFRGVFFSLLLRFFYVNALLARFYGITFLSASPNCLFFFLFFLGSLTLLVIKDNSVDKVYASFLQVRLACRTNLGPSCQLSIKLEKGFERLINQRQGEKEDGACDSSANVFTNVR